MVVMANHPFARRNDADAFTLTELLVVVATAGMIAFILLPAFGQTKFNSQSFQCLENTRRLTLAWRMYAEDNRDAIVYSSDDGNGTAYTAAETGASQPDNYAWTWSKLDFNGANAFNWDTNADMTLRPLWPYVKNTAVYKCPADASQVTVSGKTPPRIRSYSMNFFLGGYSDSASEPPPTGYSLYLKTTDLTAIASPGPSKTFVFICERSDTISWGNFATDMTGYPTPSNPRSDPAAYEWSQDVPSSYHAFSAGISFADGHAELHRWLNSSTFPPLNSANFGASFPAPTSQDVAWMQSVSARSN